MGEILSRSDLVKKLTSVRKGKKVVFTNGCFDILHVGHVTYLEQAKAEGQILVVGLNADASVKKLKGESRPVQTEEDRAKILSALASVDYVTIFSEDTPKDLIEGIKPDVLVKGGDWPVDKIVGADFVKANGGTVKTLSFVNGKSSSSLIERLKSL